MKPDFNKLTIETLAKRARHTCSNPDCRVSTTGPHNQPNKSTTLGEAAHIHGAREGSKRYKIEMNNRERAEITNAIWLCRNCHKLVDSDEVRYTDKTLFAWREIHEEYIASQIGNTTDKILFEEKISEISKFENYDQIVKRIIIDQPEGWEFSLAASILRFLNDPLFRTLEDINNGLLVSQLTFIGEDDAFQWIQNQSTVMLRLVTPINGLFNALSNSFGEPGEPAILNEIHHCCKLLHNYLEQVVMFEKKLDSTVLPEVYDGILKLFRNAIGSQIQNFSQIPEFLEEAVELVQSKEGDDDDEETIQFNKTIKFDLPESWNENFTTELNKIIRHYRDT